MHGFFREAKNTFLQFFFPLPCLGCKLPITRQSLPLCPMCLSRLEKVNTRHLDAQLSAFSFSHLKIHHTFALWYFDRTGLVQKVHQMLKYGNCPHYGLELGSYMGYHFKLVHRDTDMLNYLIPIPLHSARLISRGYNQSALLAQGFSAQTQTPVLEHLLVRPRATRPQTGLNKLERWMNVAHTFSVKRPESIKNKRILLIDDILTTGSTMLSAAQVLIMAGCKSVSLASLALTR